MTLKYKILLLTGLVFYQLTGFAQPPVPYGNNKAAGKYYNIRGFKMYCEIYGSGKPLLIIHGNGGSISDFDSTIPYFSKRYRVIIADSRSQGKSVDNQDSLSFRMMADDYNALLDTLKIDSADVLGWSDGGINALLLAMRHPDKVSKLAATGANLWVDSTAFAPGTWQSWKIQYDSSYGKVWKTQAERNAWKMFLLDWYHPNITLDALHREVKCPSLIICGDHDIISISHTVTIFQNIRRAYLWVVPDSGHATLQEHKDAFNKMVDHFFRTPFHNW